MARTHDGVELLPVGEHGQVGPSQVVLAVRLSRVQGAVASEVVELVPHVGVGARRTGRRQNCT